MECEREEREREREKRESARERGEGARTCGDELDHVGNGSFQLIVVDLGAHYCVRLALNTRAHVLLVYTYVR
jgi:hypothetical protein